MIETAKKHANAPVPGAEVAPAVEENEGAEQPAEAEGAETSEKVMQETGEEKAKVDGAAAEEEEESDDPAQIEMRRERAKKILKALGAR